MELLVFSLFAAALLVCVIFHISLLFALLLGYVIFALYAIRKGFSLPEVLGMSAQGVRAAKNILTTYYNVFTVEGTAASRVFFRIVA